jgi:hypothetical protein
VARKKHEESTKPPPRWVKEARGEEVDPPEEKPPKEEPKPIPVEGVSNPVPTRTQAPPIDARPWTPPDVSPEEHQRQIDETAAKPTALEHGDPRKAVPRAPQSAPPPVSPQHEQAQRLQAVWDQAQALNPAGMPVTGVQLSDATLETKMEHGVEVTTLRLGQNYVAGPDAKEQPHAVGSSSSERPTVPCPHCGGTGEVSAGWVEANADGNGSAA